MIFLSAAEPNLFVRVHGAEFSMEPIKLPEVDTTHIIAMEGALAKRVLAGNDGRLHRISFETEKLPGFPKPFSMGSHVKPSDKVLIIRGGGIGDVLMCTPVFRVIRESLPTGAQLMLSTFKNHIPFFENNPHLDAVLPQPLTLATFLEADYYLEFSAPVSEISQTHMTDFYLKMAGIDPSGVTGKQPEMDARPMFHEKTANQMEKESSGFKHLAYLNGIASDRLRDLPPSILRIFIQQNPDVFFFIPRQYSERYPETMHLLNAPNSFELDTRKTFSGFVTAINCCHMTITTDSSAYHIAASLGKPCLTLFGPIDPGFRTRYYPTVISLAAQYNGHTCQSPCGKSMISEFKYDGIDGKKKCPEALANNMDFSPCLASFSENRLMDGCTHLIEQQTPGAMKRRGGEKH
jgi:hypothetical protein